MPRSPSLIRILSTGLAALALGCFLPAGRAQTKAFNDTFTGASTVNSNPPSPVEPAVTAAAYQQLAAKTFNPNPPVITSGNLRFGIVSTSSGFNHVQALFTKYPVTLVNTGDYIELTVNFSAEGGILTPQTNSTLFFGLYNAGHMQPLPGGMNGSVATATAGYAQTWQGYVSRIFYAGGNHGFYARPAQTAAGVNNQDLLFNYASAAGVGSTSVSTLAALSAGSPYTEVYRITKASATTLTLASSLYAGPTPTGTPLYTQSATSTSTLTSVYDAFAFGWRSTASVASVMNVSSVKITTTGTTTIIPEILSQPLSLTKMLGENVSLSVVADGGVGTALTYQWKKDGADIAGATSASHEIASAALTDTGDYTVVITDVAGSTTSTTATLTVTAGAVPPSIIIDPTGGTLLVGGSHAFNITANGTNPLTYQWQKSTDNGANYTDIVGAMANTYAISGAVLADAGLYRIVVTNAQGSATSAAAALIINQSPAITVQPIGTTLNPGASLNLSVTASGSPAPSYQWKKNGVSIVGATASTYNVAAVSGADTGAYSVVVSNAVGFVNSAVASVAVLSATMAQTAVTPLPAAIGLNPDTRLTITFNEAVTPGVSGTLRIYDAANDTVVDTIDLAAATALRDMLRASSTLSTQLLPVQSKTIGGIPNNFNYYPITVTGSKATIYPRNGVLAYNKSYYIKIEPGVFVNTAGEAFAGIANNTAWAFSTKAAGPIAGSTSLTVAADGSGDFNTLQAALDFIPSANIMPTTIRVKRGTYFEEVGFQSKHFITILGEDIDQTVIAYPNNNTFNNVSGVYHRATLVAQSVHDFTLAHLTITNTTPQNGSQAEAIVINGSSATAGRNLVTHCKFYSYQDTVQFNKQTYVSDSTIHGDVDFMWGDGPAFFENCDIRILRTGGYFTQIRNGNTNHGYVFRHCRFTAPAGITGTFFGRIDPTGFPFSEVVVLDSTVGDATNNALLATATGVSGANYPGGWWLLNNVANTATATNVHNWANTLLDGNGAALAHPNADTFTTMPADATVQANYRDVTWVLNTNIAGVVNGSWTPALAPVIAAQPVSLSVVVGEAVNLSVTVAALPAATFQWKKDGVDIAGATAATYLIASATPADIGHYTVVATNSAGTVTSSAATLTVSEPVTIVTPPQTQNATVGDTVAFTVTATGYPAPTFQWLKDGVAIPAATSATLTLGPITTATSGEYAVVVTNPLGSQTSNAASLIVTKAVASIALGNLNQTYNGAAKTVTATSAPGGLAIILTYDGSVTPPTHVGSYAVDALIDDVNYFGGATGTLTINEASASLTLDNLRQAYDGTPKPATATTAPANLAVTLSYNGSTTPPTYPGTYTVEATIDDPNYQATATGTLVISVTALVRHAPTLHGTIEGSVQVLSGENLTLAGHATVAGDLLVPGTPGVQRQGQALYAGVLDGPGAAAPANYSIRLSGHSLLRYLVRRIDPLVLPTVTVPPAPTGTRSVVLLNARQSAGDFASLRHLLLSGNAGLVRVPPGTYGSFIATGNSGFILGVAGATESLIYNFQNLSINPLFGAAQLKIVGPVILTVANTVTIFGPTGSAAHPEWLTLRIYSGGLVVAGNIGFHGSVIAPNSVVSLLASCTLNGSVIADQLTISADSLLNGLE